MSSSPPIPNWTRPSPNRLFQHQTISTFDARRLAPGAGPSASASLSVSAPPVAAEWVRYQKRPRGRSSSDEEGGARGQPRRKIRRRIGRARGSVSAGHQYALLGSPISLRPAPSRRTFAPVLTALGTDSSDSDSSDLDAAEGTASGSPRRISPLARRFRADRRRRKSFSLPREVRPAESSSSGASSEDEVDARAGEDADGEAESVQSDSDIESEVMPKDGRSGSVSALSSPKPYHAEKRKFAWIGSPEKPKIVRLVKDVKQAGQSSKELLQGVYRLELADGSDVSMSDRESVVAHLIAGLDAHKSDVDMLSEIDEMITSDAEWAAVDGLLAGRDRAELVDGPSYSFANKEVVRQNRVYGVDLGRAARTLVANANVSMSWVRLLAVRKRCARKVRGAMDALRRVNDASFERLHPRSEQGTFSAEADIAARGEARRRRDMVLAQNAILEERGIQQFVDARLAEWKSWWNATYQELATWNMLQPAPAAEERVEMILDAASPAASSEYDQQQRTIEDYDGSTPLIVFPHHARTYEATLDPTAAREPEAAVRRARLHHLRATDSHLRAVAERHEIAALRATWQRARQTRREQAEQAERDRRAAARAEAERRYIEQARREAAAEREAEEERWVEAQRERARAYRAAQAAMRDEHSPFSAVASSSRLPPRELREVSLPIEAMIAPAIPTASPPMYQPPLLPAAYVRAASVPVQLVSSAVRAAGNAFRQASSPQRARQSLSPSMAAGPSTYTSISGGSREASSSPEAEAASASNSSPPATPPLPAYNGSLYHPASPAPPPPYNAQSGYEVLEVDDLLGEVEDSDDEDEEQVGQQRAGGAGVPGAMEEQEQGPGRCVVM